jgi:hypothetical protein
MKGITPVATTLISPERILPTRMTLQVPQDTSIRLSLLDFPYDNALNAFMERFRAVYYQTHQEYLPYHLRLPFRQLNDCLLTLARSLVQGFELYKGGSRMVTFTRYEDNHAEDFPSLSQIQSLIRYWLELWSRHPEIQPLLNGDAKQAWQALQQALKEDPESEWQHGINPLDLAANLNHQNGLAFIALPALLTSLLHQQEMWVQSEKGSHFVKWRRAHDGGNNGLHLVSQPIPFEDDFFAYRLDFSVQTQAGYVDVKGKDRFWVFAHLSIQRYIPHHYRGGDKDRNISILVGPNLETFSGRWDDDTTLIRLGVEKENFWEHGVGDLLNAFANTSLPQPSEILANPYAYGNYAGKTSANSNEYYVVYAEGRKFGDGKGRGHQLHTGTSLRERSQIMEGVLALLNGWLVTSPPLERDIQNPKNTFALRDYEYMIDSKRKNNQQQIESWRGALETSLKNSGCDHAHIVVLYRSDLFREWAETQINEALMGVDSGESPLATVTFEPLQPLLYTPLNPGSLDEADFWKPKNEKSKDFNKQWKKQKPASYAAKRDQWRERLQEVEWQPNARRLLLIDSTGENGTPDERKIKGAVRDACVREGVSSQFIVGDFKLDSRAKFAGRLDGKSSGRLQNAVLDLLLRQQGILYAPPREIYENAAKLDSETAQQLDVIAFCRVNRNRPKLNYVLAVRLRADGEVDVLLPGDTADWLPYDKAAYVVGKLFSGSRVKEQREEASSPHEEKFHPLRLNQGAMVNFVEDVLMRRLERPTIAVIEAEGWRNGRGEDEDKHCWTQLQNPRLFKSQDRLIFDTHNRSYERAAPALDPLLAVVRLRMNAETPQYVTAETWSDENPMRDLEHLTGYIDPCVPSPLHYMSVAGLSEGQKGQNTKETQEALKTDARNYKGASIAYKHPQMVEMVPFFVAPRFQNDEGLRQLCRCIHFLRISPGFTLGEIVLPYPMHLGEVSVEDMICIVD